MKLLLKSAIAFFLFLPRLYAQVNDQGLSDQVVIQTKEVLQADSIEISFEIKINDFKALEWVEFKLGKTESDWDLIGMDLQYLEVNNQPYLKDYQTGTLFPIDKNGKVTIKKLIAKADLSSPKFLNIKLKDKDSQELSRLNKNL